ncbi:MAG: phosphoribosylanthranilate isomerase [Desulfovibrio sp.]|nr:phosphoribosylanthranilate isomerase [Desulfovibrio sp.]
MLVKICGLTRNEDVAVARELQVDLCGFIFAEKSPRYVDPEWVASCETGTMGRVGVFVGHDASEICRIMHKARLDYAQLHGAQSEDVAEAIGADRVIRVLWPDRYSHKAQLYAAVQKHPNAAYYLLDAGFTSGGSGRSFSWEEVAGISFSRPWFLAGGLSSKNVRRAWFECRPDGVDFNSGVEEAPGRKNPAKMRDALHVLRGIQSA